MKNMSINVWTIDCVLVQSNLVSCVFYLVFQSWDVFVEVTEIFILVPAVLGMKGNLEMTMASRLSTAVSSCM